MRQPYPQIVKLLEEAANLARDDDAARLVYMLETAKLEAESIGTQIKAKIRYQ
ncbi:MAG: hypothetical protein N4A65_00635 [Cohaesibacter sp.]|jgi:hypothetical protein|nr:hypothetical protein [Cohaesibacter sp.]